ncbi:MAG: hypothetical protein PHH85_05600 [Candidatus Methanoperedens sp.]|nr:hypothetical protein [Candidatus Methanoperedens sp.]
MSIRELEEEILEIEKVKEHFKSGSLEWNNIEAIINDKKKELRRLKTQVDGEEDNVVIGCGGDCGGCGGGR